MIFNFGTGFTPGFTGAIAGDKQASHACTLIAYQGATDNDIYNHHNRWGNPTLTDVDSNITSWWNNTNDQKNMALGHLREVHAQSTECYVAITKAICRVMYTGPTFDRSGTMEIRACLSAEDTEDRASKIFGELTDCLMSHRHNWHENDTCEFELPG